MCGLHARPRLGRSRRGGLTMAEGDTSLGEIVGRQLHGDLVAGENANAIAAQAAREVGQNDAFVIQLDAEQSTGELLKYRTGYFDAVFFTQRFSLLPFSPIRQPAARPGGPVDEDVRRL